MEKKNLQYLVVIFSLVIAVVGMSVAFAFQDIEVTVSGNVTTEATTWDVHFDEVSNISGVTATNAVSIGTDTTTASYTVTLSKPGDYYEFTVSVINDGDFDAVLKTLSLTSTNDREYLNHTVTYNGSDYTNASNTISNGNVLSPDETENIKVRVEYVAPDDEADLPTSDVELTLSVTLLYTQSK